MSKQVLQYCCVIGLSFIMACKPSEHEINALYQDYSIEKIPYLLHSPSKVQKLHWDLEEISGLSYYENDKLLAVEDETGKVYILDATSLEVIDKIRFEKGGDYEGIEYDEGTIWVMESNGNFYSFEIENEEAINLKKYENGFTTKNDLEGLAYKNGSLIIATKGEGSIKDYEDKGKGIYNIKEEHPEPLFFISLNELNKFVKDRNFFNTIKDFDPSAIAIHPITEDYYILSADHVLVVYSKELVLKEIVNLDKLIFKQPEGICFSPTGIMYISSEGDGDRGRLLVFNPLSDKE